MAQSCKGGAALANYIMQDKKGYELFRNGICGETPSQILSEMKIIQNLNQNAQNKTFSLVLSPDKTQGQKLSDKELRKITRDFMKKLSIEPEKQQFVAFVHTEKSHKHIHIIVNRVQDDGKLLSDHFIGKKAQWAAHKVAIENGLISAKELLIDKLRSIDQGKDLDRTVKNEILRKHDFVMNHHPKSMESYMKKMEEIGVKIIPTINKQGQIQGHRMSDLATGKDFKASDVHRSVGLKKLMENGLPFIDANLSFTKPLESAQNLALKISREIVTEIAKDQFSQNLRH
ncbi:relaxase/mobilization nuclease domain-containing protein [Chryseobacterium sp. LC2016-29]|uniref:relaxase/mobilization nuclease domain-containing protein n=1 Tax=Chryseobacterium sp. LC2016-29 TaxID=2897331 RepID=UPI001E33FC08|nr:relaxase/mobilization nuclease domain-containing protein [Chryseobacterium sp. LC2016-29]MCD0477457.1 relaxase/mobilization nuclease domain-containing protein [Chryseobacterium sp. LC2016-29]